MVRSGLRPGDNLMRCELLDSIAMEISVDNALDENKQLKYSRFTLIIQVYT